MERAGHLGHFTLMGVLAAVSPLLLLHAACMPRTDATEHKLALAAARVEQCETLAQTRPPTATFSALPGEGGPSLGARLWLISDDVACFDGGISAQASAWFDALAEPINHLVIRSVGGSGPAGVDIAESLVSWDSKVTVWDYCYSACASYIFVAGAEKLAPYPGVVGFHQGGLAWTRYGTLFTPAAYSDPQLRPIAQFALERFNETGRMDVPASVWVSLPEQIRAELTTHPNWRLRIVRLYNQLGIDPDIRSAHHAILGRLPDFAVRAIPAYRDGADLMWTPDAQELQRWGVPGVVMWRAEGPEQILDLGLEAVPPTLNVRADIDPSFFAGEDGSGLPDDSADWPVYGASQ